MDGAGLSLKLGAARLAPESESDCDCVESAAQLPVRPVLLLCDPFLKYRSKMPRVNPLLSLWALHKDSKKGCDRIISFQTAQSLFIDCWCHSGFNKVICLAMSCPFSEVLIVTIKYLKNIYCCH